MANLYTLETPSKNSEPGANRKRTDPKKPKAQKKGVRPAPQNAKESASKCTPLTSKEKSQHQRENRQLPERKTAELAEQAAEGRRKRKERGRRSTHREPEQLKLPIRWRAP